MSRGFKKNPTRLTFQNVFEKISTPCGGRRGRDRMVIGFTTTYAIDAYATTVVSSNPVRGEL
jgi:hypothetical protein